MFIVFYQRYEYTWAWVLWENPDAGWMRASNSAYYSYHDNKQRSPGYFRSISRYTVYLDDTYASIMLCMNACGYATIPFRVTHSKKGATDLLNKQSNWNVENIRFFLSHLDVLRRGDISEHLCVIYFGLRYKRKLENDWLNLSSISKS